MSESHKNRIIEPFQTSSRLFFNDLEPFSSCTKKLKILKGDNFAQIQTYYITAHKNRIIEA